MSQRLYVVGGQQRELRPLSAVAQDWYEYQKGLILEVDTEAGTASVAYEYISPPEVCPPVAPAILFKSGTHVGDRLYLCTQTEILILGLPGFDRIAYLSLPMFNDLHHVRPGPTGNLLVANTGLDMVIEVTLDGVVVREWNVLGADPWERFSRDVDYRRIPTTKPHLAHPNHVFYLGDEPWATRFEQRDAISLVDPARRIDIGLERLHDGAVDGGKVYFTTVDGKIAIADTTTLEVIDVVDLTTFHAADSRLGWCRGILMDGPRIWVGFSRIRPTKVRENIGWALRGFRRDFGTHIACYDLAARRLISEIALEDAGLSAVFSIFSAPGSEPGGR